MDGRVAAMRWLVGAVEDATPAGARARLVRAGGAPGGARGRRPVRRSPAPQLGVPRAARRPGPGRGRGVRGGPRSQRRARHAGLGRGAGRERDPRSSRRRRAAGMALGRASRRSAGPAGRRRAGGRRLVPRGRPGTAGDLRAGDPPDRRALQRQLRACPLRKLLNDVFIDLAAEAGADSGIIDPRGERPSPTSSPRTAGPGRTTLAADLLTGRDLFGMEFLTAFRAGELA